MKEDLLKYKREDNDFIYEDIDSFMNYISNTKYDDYTEDIIYSDFIEEDIKKRLEKDYWTKTFDLLKNIKTTDFNYYYRDTDGNFRNVTNRDINCLIDRMILNIEKNKENYEL